MTAARFGVAPARNWTPQGLQPLEAKVVEGLAAKLSEARHTQASPASIGAVRCSIEEARPTWADDDCDGYSDCDHEMHHAATASTDVSESSDQVASESSPAAARAMWSPCHLPRRTDLGSADDCEVGDVECRETSAFGDGAGACGKGKVQAALPSPSCRFSTPASGQAQPKTPRRHVREPAPPPGVLEELLPKFLLCLDAPMLATTCRSMRARFGDDFWRGRLLALPEGLLREAGLRRDKRAHLADCTGTSIPEPTAEFPASRVAALEGRALSSPQEQAALDESLHMAARRGSDCWRLLLRGARPNSRWGCSPALSLAVAAGSAATVMQLVFHGANVEAVDGNGDRALVVAVLHRHAHLVRLLLDLGASPDEPDGHGDTPLICATVAGQVDVIKALLEGGADTEATDPDGDTPLICAVVNDRADAIRALAQGGADMDAPDDAGGDVPLIRAVTYGHASSVEALLECRARPDARSARGESALEVAAANGHGDILGVLARALWAKTKG